MARMHKTIEIGEKSITVHELTVDQIINLLNDDSLAGLASDGKGKSKKKRDDDLGLGSVQAFAKRHLSNATDLKIEDIRGMAPSELKEVYNAFAEVNAVFFDIARAAGMEALLLELKSAIVEDFSKLLADLLKQDM